MGMRMACQAKDGGRPRDQDDANQTDDWCIPEYSLGINCRLITYIPQRPLDVWNFHPERGRQPPPCTWVWGKSKRSHLTKRGTVGSSNFQRGQKTCRKLSVNQRRVFNDWSERADPIKPLNTSNSRTPSGPNIGSGIFRASLIDNVGDYGSGQEISWASLHIRHTTDIGDYLRKCISWDKEINRNISCVPFEQPQAEVSWGSFQRQKRKETHL